MPYAPTVNDNSGQILAQGIQQGVAGLNQGIQQWIKKNEEKKQQEQAFGMIRALTDPSIPDEAVRSTIKGMGVAGALQTGQMLTQQKRQAVLDEETRKYQAIHLAGIEAGTKKTLQELDQMGRDAAALKDAFSYSPNPGSNPQFPPMPLADGVGGQATDAVMNAVNRPAGMGAPAPGMDMGSRIMRAAQGGASAPTLQQLAAMAENLAQADERARGKSPAVPYTTVINGKTYVVSNGNAQPVPDAKAGYPREITVNGNKMTQLSSTMFVDESGNVLGRKDDSNPTLNDVAAALMLNQNPDLRAQLELGKKKNTAAPPAAPTNPDFSKYEGQSLKGPDGNTYLIKNGKPVKQ